MCTASELIEKIQTECQQIHELAAQLQERYRVLSNLLVCAHTQVPDERWEMWLQGNFGLDIQTAETVIEGGMIRDDVHQMPLPGLFIRLDNGNEKQEHVSRLQDKNGRRKKKTIQQPAVSRR